MKADSHIAPFFAESISPVPGLNHLGLRNAAEDLFTSLLPGLNGVTERVRYYSFYCWLTGEFMKRTSQDDRTPEEYRLFVRKAEFLIAMIQAARNPEIIGIPGITFALDTLRLSYTSFDLMKCVDNPIDKRRTKGTYWANPGGVLRQYYNASMKDMALLPGLAGFPSVSVPSREDDLLPEGTILGEDLGEAFCESVGESSIALFLSCVDRSRVSRDELKAMANDFVMKGFGDIGRERDLLISAFNQKDFPASETNNRHLRKKTISHFLNYCKQVRQDGAKDAIAFPAHIYRAVLDGTFSDDCALGWYGYHVNDLWQYDASIILYCVLDILKDSGWVSADKLSRELADGMASLASPNAPNITLGSVCEMLDSGSLRMPEGRSVEAKALRAMLDILRLYCENRAHRDTVENYKLTFKDLRKPYTFDFFRFMEELDNQQSVPLDDLLNGFIREKVITRHHTVSLIKYCQTGIASNKFLFEDGFLRYVGQTEYTHTSPRIASLIEYLSDLGLLKDMVPTDDAILRYGLN